MAEQNHSKEPKAEQPKAKQKKNPDDRDLAAGRLATDKTPGKGKPDKEEGVGTVQNQKR